MTTIEIEDCLKESVVLLTGHSEFPVLETQVLMSTIFQTKREWLITHPHTPLSSDQLAQFLSLRDRLLKGEPLAYLIGKQAFFGLIFEVNQHVLIPRPETELLVEESIDWLERNPLKRTAADVGTGSGIIAVCLADRFSDLLITATDISSEALTVAKQNAEKYRVSNQIQFIQNNLLSGLTTKFDLIVANLPYIPSAELIRLEVSKFEPRLALDGGTDGLNLIKKLVTQIKTNLKPRGLVLLEIEANQSQKCVSLIHEAHPTVIINVLNDLAKHPRIVKLQF